MRVAVAALIVGGVAGVGGCQREAQVEAPKAKGGTATASHVGGYVPTAAEAAFLDSLAHRTFLWFWEQGNPSNGMIPDRWPTESFVSVAAVGFGLTAYPIGAERGWITRAQAAERTLNTLRFFWAAPMDSTPTGVIGYRGLYYHFLEPATGHRFRDVELSTIDTALLLAGALFCQSYFDAAAPAEQEIRALADSIYFRADFRWTQVRPPTICLAWGPENGFEPYDWRGYNEAMILHILAIASPTHPVGPEAWSDSWLSRYRWGEFHGQEHVGFAPLFGHQYSHIWIDFRGIQDSYMREKGIDYFENSRRATLAQQAYAVANPAAWSGYAADCWGLTACDGPLDTAMTVNGRPRQFFTYRARGASFTETQDDGTLAPTAVGGSIPFAPEIAIPTLLALRTRYGEPLYGQYGFVDAFNPSWTTAVRTQHGRIVPGVGWFDTDYLGIDQGPILAQIENWRTGLVWTTLRRNPHIVRGLRAAGFTGGWLEGATPK